MPIDMTAEEFAVVADEPVHDITTTPSGTVVVLVGAEAPYQGITIAGQLGAEPAVSLGKRYESAVPSAVPKEGDGQ
jgi:hypothetical protein